MKLQLVATLARQSGSAEGLYVLQEDRAREP